MGIRHIGVENAKIISENVINISDFVEIVKKNKFSNFLNIDGIGETQVNSMQKFFSNKLNINVLVELKDLMNIQKENLKKSGKLKKMTFMITGKLNGISRAEIKSIIEKNSGITLSTVNKNLNYLIIGDKPTNRKVEEAKKIGVKVISQDELMKLLN